MTEPPRTEQDDDEGAESAPHGDAVPGENPDSAADRALERQILQDLGTQDQPNEHER